jgi:hypothetical protein
MRKILGLTLIAGGAMLAAPLSEANAASLRGSPAAMVEQNRVAKDHGLAFFRTPDDIRTAVSRGELEELTGNDDYAVADFVSFPYLQPAVKLFVERLAAQYREACGQKLVVTSAVRPSSGQPRNAHALSVHPAGMAVDLRVSDRASCRISTRRRAWCRIAALLSSSAPRLPPSRSRRTGCRPREHRRVGVARRHQDRAPVHEGVVQRLQRRLLPAVRVARAGHRRDRLVASFPSCQIGPSVSMKERIWLAAPPYRVGALNR